MPLATMLVRDGEVLPFPWSNFAIGAAVMASALDSGKGPWPRNTYSGIFRGFSGRRPSDDTWHSDDKCTGLRQGDGSNKWLCLGCGGFYPLVLSPGYYNMIGYPHFATTPLNRSGYALEHRYLFIDAADAEVITFQPGDVIKFWRESK